MLVVDDSPADREYCEIMLQQAGGYGQILHAETGEQALALLASHEESRRAHPETLPIRVIFLDINMPRMNGFEFLEAYESSRLNAAPGEVAAVVIVMLSSSGNERERRRAEAFPSVLRWIEKPLTHQQAGEIRNWLLTR